MFNSIFHRKEEEDRVRGEGRLPPGQSLTQKFPVLHYGPVPPFNAAAWDFRIFGQVEEESTWTWHEFNQLPRTTLVMDIHCVTRWSKFDTQWEGVSVRTLGRSHPITATHCAVWSAISQHAMIFKPHISGKAPSGCAAWNSHPKTSSVFGSRLVITMKPTFGRNNASPDPPL